LGLRGPNEPDVGERTQKEEKNRQKVSGQGKRSSKIKEEGSICVLIACSRKGHWRWKEQVEGTQNRMLQKNKDKTSQYRGNLDRTACWHGGSGRDTIVVKVTRGEKASL